MYVHICLCIHIIKMFCEPNFNLNKILDLKSIKKSSETNNDQEVEFQHSRRVKPKVSYEQKEYKVIPIFQDEFAHLNDILSLRSNEYLACRWNSFLDNVPANYTRLSLYMDYKKSLEPRVIRRKILNGQFYGINNKLEPVPKFSDPRSVTKKREVKNKTRNK